MKLARISSMTGFDGIETGKVLRPLALRKPDGEDVRFNLLTAPDPEDLERQAGYLEQIRPTSSVNRVSN